MKENVLIRHRPTIAQVELHPRERYQNVAGAFMCSSSAKYILDGRKILLIDDVSTTGATLEACATPLFDAAHSRFGDLCWLDRCPGETKLPEI